MTFLFLHGPPAAGKLTIAKAVAEQTGYRLFHNHLTVDLALSVYDFGTPGFIALREQIWLAVIRRVLSDRMPGLIFTFNPESSVPQRFIDELFAEVTASGARLISVELTADAATIEERLGSASRRQHHKLTDLVLYRQLRDAGVFSTPRIPRSDLSINTGNSNPTSAATEIVHLINEQRPPS